ncbi:MAG: LysM peptidoglycan-binding domain-containing protein, partial [Duodenibacillus sp.]|nr:LysM peptidoglycan-binding domain-containing protein [Duodenibacillus sp.]
MKIKLWQAALIAAAALAGCTSVNVNAPIDNRATPLGQGKGSQAPSYGRRVVSPARAHLAEEYEPADSGRTHVVASGETVWRIGQSYGVNPREILSLNGIQDPSKLYAGQRLRLPEGAADQARGLSEEARRVKVAAPAPLPPPTGRYRPKVRDEVAAAPRGEPEPEPSAAPAAAPAAVPAAAAAAPRPQP